MRLLVRRRVVSVVALLLTFGLCCFVIFHKSREPPEAPNATLPTNESVKELLACLSESHWRDPPISEFSVPREYIPTILGFLRPPQRVDFVDDWFENGYLKLLCEDNQVVELRLFEYGKGPVRFTLNGVRCFRGGDFRPIEPNTAMYLEESLTLRGILREIHWELVNHKKSEQLPKFIKLLETSAGH